MTDATVNALEAASAAVDRDSPGTNAAEGRLLYAMRTLSVEVRVAPRGARAERVFVEGSGDACTVVVGALEAIDVVDEVDDKHEQVVKKARRSAGSRFPMVPANKTVSRSKECHGSASRFGVKSPSTPRNRRAR